MTIQMLRFLIPAALVLLGAATAEAQIRVGAAAGPAFSTLLVEEGIFDLDTRRGVTVEARIVVPVKGRFSVLTRPGYVQRGAVNDDFGATIIQDYIVLPVLALFGLEAGGVRPYAATGLAPAIAVSRQAKGSVFEDGSVDRSRSVEAFDLTAEFELGIEVPRRRGPDFVVGGRYAHGLVNTDRGGVGGVYNRTFGFTAGLMWTL